MQTPTTRDFIKSYGYQRNSIKLYRIEKRRKGAEEANMITTEDAITYLEARNCYAIIEALPIHSELIDVVEEMMQTISLEEAIMMKESGITLSDLVRGTMGVLSMDDTDDEHE